MNGPQSSSAALPSNENAPPLLGHFKSAIPGQSSNLKAELPTRSEKGPLARPAYIRRASHDLFECIESTKSKRFSEDDAKYIFAQVVDVVIYLYNNGITHCDIKDENVVIDSSLKVRIHLPYSLGVLHLPVLNNRSNSSTLEAG